ncbi:carcinoembryonic antigen-related cell adhesion molecule 5 [Anoplopoma fimbria]|uniref:carcinoembryonic antigen-related cell adhesion molecule 5 n=1 Tax=Anoplopoma fimbria TaxID=229290 RepID=UPI0023ED7209|nr:carcinoembryonic antigen-related cell adhesion molecule 5 [Anoplopoma fimbria]
MWLVKVFSIIYFTACAAEDPQHVSSTFRYVSPTIPMPMSTEISTPYERPVPSLQLHSEWFDVFPSEKVELSCNVNGNSDWTFTWYQNTQQVQDSDPNVSLSVEGSKLTITAATQTYSGSYSCKAHHKTKGFTTESSNSVKLTVHANRPKPTLTRSSNFDQMFPGESVTFTCKVDVSSGWVYLWYSKGTNEIQAPDNNTYTIESVDHSNSGQYHCKAKRGKDPFFTEESDTTALQVSDPPKPSLKLLSSWSDVFENETVKFSCGVNSPDWTFTWYRDQKELLDEVDIIDIMDSSLNITLVTLDHQGVYACKVHLNSRRVSSEFSNTVSVTVYENIPTPTVNKVPGFNPMYVGETVTLNCKVDVSSGWEYQWYKYGIELPSTNETNSIYLALSDRGKYSCKATRSEIILTDFSEEIQQNVLEIPIPLLKLITQWSDVFPTESVKLTCGMEGSLGWIYTWYKHGLEVQADDVASVDSNGATLSIHSASAEHTGEYNCKGHLSDRSVSSHFSSGLTLNVYDEKPRVTLTQDPEYKVMFPGESVTFSCHINVSSGWEYLWLKDRALLSESGNKYLIKSLDTTKTGSYVCQAKRGSDQAFFTDSSQAILLKVEGNKPKPVVTQQPDVEKVYTGESVSFECKVGLSSGWGYHWYKDETPLSINDSSLTIHDANSSNSGIYKCKAIRDKTSNTQHSDGRILRVSEIPVPSLNLSTPWLDVFPTERVKLICRMDGTTDWKYTWFKDKQPVQADNTASFDLDAATLSISSASASRRGQYSCSGKLKSRSVSSILSSGLTLDVYDTKPRVTLVQDPKHNVMHTEDSVSFSCHINVSSGWEYLWLKDGVPLVESRNNHTIKSVVRTNTGSYQCQAKRKGDTVFSSDQSQAVRLDIEERPQTDIILLTGWSEVFSTDSLVLRCRVQESQDMWNFTWFKEGQPIDRPPSEKHAVTPQNDPEQSLYTCQGIRTGRPSYSRRSDSFKTKNLLLKRRVLLSISGCIFFGIIAVFLGCIVLRVFRKPADGEERPEEPELFLTMAQLKDRDDAPCPLVQYITDGELNASSKEAEEDVTSCSETTPLPITSLADQDVTNESEDASEKNGGLVSFK